MEIPWLANTPTHHIIGSPTPLIPPTITQPAKCNKIVHMPSPDNNNQLEDDSTHSTEHVETVNQLPKNQSSQKQSQSTKRELCSSKNF